MIRRATRKDIESIYVLGTFLHENYRNLNNLNELMNEPYHRFFVAEKDGHIVAFLSITELYETVDILDLFVLPEYRRGHIGSRLINYMIGDVGNQVKLFTLEVAVDNQAAIDFYQKFGFEIETKRLFYYGDKDAYLMGLRCNKE